MAKLFINEKKQKGHINPEIYGHFSEHLGRCIYEGLYVGENSEIPNVHGMRKDVVDALKDMKIPVLRWPGGCFADEYHWRDGIGPKETRKKMVNTHWGGVTEDNSFGTHEFFELCEQIGCKTYINGNVGSGSVQEMSEWVEYMTFDGVSPMAELRKQNGHEKPWKVDYFGVGNENWGCGGNMTPEYYGNLYRRYQTYVRNYNNSAPIQKICCGANAGDFGWTKDVLATCYKAPAPEHAHGFMEGLSLHYYTVPEDGWSHKGSATDFDEKSYYKTLSKTWYMKELIEKHKKDMESTKKSLDKYIAEDERYMKVRDEIEKWIPPTSEHENVKKFALNQIDISLNTDMREYCNKELSKDLDISDEAVYSYMNDINEFYENDVARAYKRWQEELKRTADKNMWMKQFLDSLENI